MVILKSCLILANSDYNLSWEKHLVGRGVVIFAEELWLCRGPREQTAGNVISSLCMLYLDMFFFLLPNSSTF